MKNRQRTFLNLPEFPGGKEALRRYIRENLQYPDLAKTNRIEGIVYLNAEIDDNGKVLNVDVVKGLGYGCNEEAIRLIRSIRFGGVKNIGKRVKITKKFKIEFKIPIDQKVRYVIKPAAAINQKEENNKKPGYSYTISF